jgi:hypothetical protein
MRHWKTTEVATLRQLYPIRATADVARIIGRSIKAIQRKAEKLRIAKNIESAEA